MNFNFTDEKFSATSLLFSTLLSKEGEAKDLRTAIFNKTNNTIYIFSIYIYIHQLNFTFKQLDINEDSLEIIRLCQEYKIKTIVNFASQSMVAESSNYPWHWYKTNVTSFSFFTKYR